MPEVAYAEEFGRLSNLLEKGLAQLRVQSQALAEAEQAYRQAKAEAWVKAPTGEHRGEWPVPQREAWVDAETADLRYVRDLAEGTRQAALEAVRSRRTQISAWQSLLGAEREEAAFSRTAPVHGP